MRSSGELFMSWWDGYCRVFFSLVAAQLGKKHQNNIRVGTYIILFLTRHNESINDPCLIRLVYVLLMTSQWPDNCDANT